MEVIALEALIVFISQAFLVFFKHLNVRVITSHYVYKSMILTLLIQLSWLVASALGIKALLAGDWLVVAAYLIGGVGGNYANFKINIHK